MSNFPNIPEDLLKSLDETFPNRCPEPTWNERQIWMEVGARKVIRFLQAKFDEQNQNILGDQINVR